MLNEDWIRKYMNNCTKDAIIELYLQMRFERDMYADLYENLKVISKGNDKQWSLNDSKVAYGYTLGYEDATKDMKDDLCGAARSCAMVSEVE